MPITEILEKNASLYPNDVSLVEISPKALDGQRKTWKEYSLIETDRNARLREEITWQDFDCRANRFANLLLSRGIKKGDKVGILLMNCLEWLPIYFGILKTGALAVPLNYRYTASEIKYCLSLADVSALVFGPEFTGRIEEICNNIPEVKFLFYLGEDCPTFAESYEKLVDYCSSRAPKIKLTDDDEAAIYFSSGTTGFPKAIIHAHRSLMHAAKVEQNHHSQTKDDVFLCIPPLYHTGAIMHWFGSFLVGGKGVLLRGVKPKTIIKAVSDEGEIVGFTVADIEEDGDAPFGMVCDVLVKEGCRSQGTGAALLQTAIDWLRSRGVKDIYLESGKDNHAAHRFFEKRGFAHVSEIYKLA